MRAFAFRPLLTTALPLALGACDSAAAPTARAAESPPPPTTAAWSAPVTIPSSLRTFSTGDHRVSDLHAGADGRLHAVFLDDANGDRRGDRVLYAAFDGSAWSEVEVLDDTPGLSEAARVVEDGAGAVHVFWYEDRAGCGSCASDLLHRERRRGGWAAPVSLYREEGRGGVIDPFLTVTRDAAGRVHLLHTRAGAGFAHRVRAGSAWLPSQTTDRDGIYPRWQAGAARDELPMVYVAGYVAQMGQSVTSDVWTRAFRAGTWGPPVVVYHDAGGYSHDPQALTTADGVRHVVWLEGEGGVHPRKLLHATSPDGERWERPRDITPADVPGEVLYSPRLAPDGRGGMHLTFARFGDGYSHPRHFHTRFDGARWSPAREIVPGSNPDSELETATDARGTLHAVWKGADGLYRHSRLEA